MCLYSSQCGYSSTLDCRFWVVFSLPVSFLAAFALVPSLGLTINMLTMIGLLMALGILMDDGIVIAENIAPTSATGRVGNDRGGHRR